ncbi:MAG: D-alanyl-D-alanine carboxypeptidase, partial [Lachnospiraceae bacterium]|nr:D-alanyl-D-alanine carboxypeptidase [Lachnospiraceae bacterium]
EISNWFLRRIEDKDAHGEVMCAKTGFVDQSGCCAASYQISNDGGHYFCVTGNAWSSWRCIYDHVRIYDLYTN